MPNWLLHTPPALTVPSAAARAFIAEHDGAAALLFFHMQLNGGRLDVNAACEELALSDEALNRALSSLQRLGLAGQENAPSHVAASDKRPDYTPNDLTVSLNGDNNFKQLSEDVSRKLGKILSNTDMATLFGLYDWLGLPADVISLLIVWCIDEAHRRYGIGRMPTMRQIEKTAVEWEAQGLITAERAESWMTEREKARQSVARIARILQISGRVPTATEESYIRQWAQMGFAPDVIYAAYDKTVTRCGKLEWKYMHTILKSWHSKELLTLDALERDAKPAGKQNQPLAKGSRPGDFEREAAEAMRQRTVNNEQ